MHIFIIILLLGILGCKDDIAASNSKKERAHTDSDASYIYQNRSDIQIDIIKRSHKQSVRVKREKDNKILIDTGFDPFYIDKSDSKLNISYDIVKKEGGFDLLFRVENKTTEPQLMPNFQIPGIKLRANRSLDILNTNTKQYMERRYLNELKNWGYFMVSSYSQIDKNGKKLQEEYHYASDTLSPYSPVIVAKDGDFAVGTSLNYPILEYIDKQKKIRGEHGVLLNKLYPKMRIYKERDSYRFSYEFDDEGVLKARINPKSIYKFTIPVRFSPPRYWLLTLYPYKEYFLNHYPVKDPSLKDVSPILLVNFSFYGDSVTKYSKRGWSWAFEGVDKNGYSYLPLYQVSDGLSRMMKKMGYKRVLFTTFSGVYNANISPDLNEELPFQFLSNLEPNMKKELIPSLNIFKKAGQKFGFWWGIAGMMPVDKNKKVIDFDTWQPHSDIPFVLSDPTHRAYAKRELDAAKAVKTDMLTLDAYVRMEENDRITWLKKMKKYAPKIKFALEQQVDFMHSYAAITLQPENPAFDNIDYSKSELTKPALLAHYLNPESEIDVWLEYSGVMKKMDYVKRLVKWGYTPLILLPSSDDFDHDEANVTKRILKVKDLFIPVYDLDNSKIVDCIDGVDNDKDNLVDWPYDGGCSTPIDMSE